VNKLLTKSDGNIVHDDLRALSNTIVVMEASGMWYNIYECLTKRHLDVRLSHPAKTRAIAIGPLIGFRNISDVILQLQPVSIQSCLDYLHNIHNIQVQYSYIHVSLTCIDVLHYTLLRKICLNVF